MAPEDIEHFLVVKLAFEVLYRLRLRLLIGHTRIVASGRSTAGQLRERIREVARRNNARPQHLFGHLVAKQMLGSSLIPTWCPHRDSNADLFLRTELLYPLSYGGVAALAAISILRRHVALMDRIVIEHLFRLEPQADLKFSLFFVARSVD